MMKPLDCPLHCGREDGLAAGEDANNSAQFDELLLILDSGGRNVRVFFNVLVSRTRHWGLSGPPIPAPRQISDELAC